MGHEAKYSEGGLQVGGGDGKGDNVQNHSAYIVDTKRAPCLRLEKIRKDSTRSIILLKKGN